MELASYDVEFLENIFSNISYLCFNMELQEFFYNDLMLLGVGG